MSVWRSVGVGRADRGRPGVVFALQPVVGVGAPVLFRQPVQGQEHIVGKALSHARAVIACERLHVGQEPRLPP